MTNTKLKILLLSVWMYFGGPLIWSAWISLRLQIYTIDTFLRFLLPSGIIVLSLFFILHIINIRGTLFKIERQKKRKPESIIKFHYLLVAAFGILGTFLFLAIPEITSQSSNLQTPGIWLHQTIKGSIAGAALVGMFYPFFSIRILAEVPDYPKKATTLHYLSAISYFLGISAYIATAISTGTLNELSLGTIVGLLFPVLMSAALLWKSHRLLATIPRQTGAVL